MNRIATLWHLQTIDLEIDDKTKRARLVEAALADDPKVAAARAALASAEQQLTLARGSLRNQELDAQTLDSKIKEVEQRLYGGHVSNPKELDGLDQDLQMHKRRRSELDDTLLKLMESVDAAVKREGDERLALKKIEATRAGELEKLEREKELLNQRLTELSEQREQARAALDVETLRQYDQLRRAKAGRAVAQVKGDSCSVCGVTVPSGLVNRVGAGEELILCTSCGRILA